MKLSMAQESLLSKGLKFIPNKRSVDLVKVLADLSEWERRMRLREFFYDEHKNVEEGDAIFTDRKKKRSDFNPAKGRDMWSDTYIELVKNDVVANLKRPGTMNLSNSEEKAMKELLHNDEIVIRPADKGSGVVVIDRTEYVAKLRAEIESNTSYMVMDGDKTEEAVKNIKKVVNKMYRDATITKDMKQYLIPRYPKAGRLKGNPKLHKKEVPYRTIVNGIGTTTENLAETAEKELDEYVRSSPSYIKDTTDFLLKLQEIPRPLPKDCILFCFDVVKLYPSIPLKEGLKACEEALEARSYDGIPTNEILQMIELVLKNNIFGFDGKFYKQTSGVAIRSKLGKNFACAYMRKWDTQLVSFRKAPSFYKRYIDDGFGIWTHGLEALLEFAEFANGIHSDIKVELRWSREQVDFLDTLVKVKDGEIWTDLYSKPSDRHLFLQARSCHPSSTKTGIPYGLGIRIKRICSKQEDYQRRRMELKQQLRKRGYSGKLIESQLGRVDKLDREDLLQYRYKGKDKLDRVPMVLTYTNVLPQIGKIVNKHMHTLHRSDKMKKVFQSPPLVAFRRDASLEDVLVHRKLNRIMRQDDGPCNGDCKVCPIMSTEKVSDTQGGESYKVHISQNCRTRNVVYGLVCTKCTKPVYVGETEREIRERVKEHMADIRLERDKPVGIHFNMGGHSIKDLKVTILEKVHDTMRQYRLIKETGWIRKLKTKFPEGLNTKAQCEGDWTNL